MNHNVALCCENVKKDCPLARLCYRATATPDDIRQSWTADGKPGEKCRLFMPNGWRIAPSAINSEKEK